MSALNKPLVLNSEELLEMQPGDVLMTSADTSRLKSGSALVQILQSKQVSKDLSNGIALIIRGKINLLLLHNLGLIEAIEEIIA